MSKLAVIANADSPLGRRLITDLTEMGWRVHAGYRDRLPGLLPQNVTAFVWNQEHSSFIAARDALGETVDMIISDFDYKAKDEETDTYIEAYEWHTLMPLKFINAFLPLTEKSELKRVCIVTTRMSSNYLCGDTSNPVERVSRAPLNMAATQMFNILHPKGYTFRMYCKDPEGLHDEWASEYFTRNRSYESWDLKHSDEERIILHDWMGNELPW